MKKIFTTVIVCLFLFGKLFAQGSIKGKLVDSAQKPLGLATVTVFKANDTSIITYRLSTPEGEFKVPGLPLNVACRVIVSFSGYDAFRKEFTLTNDAPVDMGTIVLNGSIKSLDEVLVISERPPVVVKKDTIEFNASSFKTLPTALVEDLLRKLPGVQIDADGNIMANGKKVNRILVDGKAFFGDDPKMATRNLPANVIEKVQVTEDKDEAARNTDGDLTQIGQVINLTLKKGVKKGWFGKAYAGAGTTDRYEVGGIANIYRDTMQLSVLAFSNNVNRTGFSFKEVQDLGGFNRSGFNSVRINTNAGNTNFAINGISFGGADQGIARSTGAGFNLNHAPTKNKSFFLQYFYGNSNTNVQQLGNTQQFINDTTVTTKTNTNTNRDQFSHTVSTGGIYKPDTLTDINFRAGYNYQMTGENTIAGIDVTNNKTGQISQGAGNLLNKFFNNSYNHNFFITHRFKAKKGRTLNMFNFVNYNSNLQRYITESENEYYVPAYEDRFFNQLRRQLVPTLSVTTNVNFSEPLSSKWTIRFNNNYLYKKDKQDIGIYDKDPSSLKYDVYDHNQSNGFERIQNKIVSTLTLSYKIKLFTISAGVNGSWQTVHNEFKNLSSPINFTRFDVLPTFQANWKQFSLNANQSVEVPGIQYLIPVPDSTNPFYIRYGNPYLKPARRTNFYLSNFNFFQGSGTTINMFISGNLADHDVVMSRTVASNGVQTVKPVNANGTAQIYANVGYGKEYKNKQKFIFSFRIAPYMSINRSKLLVNNNTSTATTTQVGPNFSVGFNWNDIVEFRPQYSPSVSATKYSDPGFTNIRSVTQYTEAELIVRWPKKFVWESLVGYRHNDQVAAGAPKDNLLWNAAVTFILIGDNKGLLKLSAYDILDRNNSFTRRTTENQIYESQTNVLRRYFHLTFTYNIRNMGAPKKIGGKDRLFMF